MNFEYWFPTVTSSCFVDENVRDLTHNKVMKWIDEKKHQTYVEQCKEDNLITSYFKWHDTLGDLELDELRSEILKCGVLFCNHLGLKNISEHQLKVDSWINFFYTNQSEHTHNHYGNFLSGVYYIAGEKNSGLYKFHDPIPQKTMWKGQFLTNAETNFTNQTSGGYVPEPGKLIIFPSWLDHSVLTNKSQSVRISIAFNINRI